MDQGFDAAARSQDFSQNAGVTPQIQGHGKAANHVFQSINQPFGGFADQEVVGGKILGGAVSALAEQSSIEDSDGIGHPCYMA